MNPAITALCDENCEVMPECLICHQRKKPIGRDAAPGSSYCGHDCKGYNEEPYPGHLWPGELARERNEETA